MRPGGARRCAAINLRCAGRLRAGSPPGLPLTVDVSEDDLRTLAERGYEGAASSDADQQGQAVGLFLNDSLLEIWPTGSLSKPSDGVTSRDGVT